MKSLVFLCTIILFSTTAYAGEESKNLFQKIIDAISRINTGKIVSSTENKCTDESIISIKSVSPLFNKCAVDICGPAKNNKSIWITDTNFSSNIPKALLKQVDEMDGKFKKIFKAAQEQKQQEQKQLRQFLEKASRNFDDIPVDLKERIAGDLFSGNVNILIDASADLEKRITVAPSLPPNASPDLVKAITAYAKQLEVSLSADSRSIDFQHAYNQNDYLPLIKMHFARVQKSFVSHKTQIQQNMDQSFKILNEIMNGEIDKLRFDQAMMHLRFIDDTITQNTKTPSLTRSTCETSECKKVFQSFLTSSQLNDSLKKYESIVASPKARSNALNHCKALLISKTMQNSEEKKRAAVFEAARKSVIQNFLPRFSSHSRSIMDEYLNQKLKVSGLNVRNKLSPPPEPIEYFNNASDYYLDTVFLPKVPDSSHWAKLNNIYKGNGDLNPYGDIYPCLGSAQVGWDSFIPIKDLDMTNPQLAPLKDLSSDDHIFISDHSCENHPQGTHNTVHEIGHALNYLFKKTELSSESAALYKSFRSCGNSYYSNASISLHPLSHEGDFVYTEEDVADLIAFATNPTDKTIYSCQLIRSNIEQDGYEGLSFKDPEDTHSTGFTRSLLEVVNKNIPLPASCQKLIEIEQPEINFKKCI